jgi:hypothetical protein
MHFFFISMSRYSSSCFGAVAVVSALSAEDDGFFSGAVDCSAAVDVDVAVEDDEVVDFRGARGARLLIKRKT